jgi:shikimate kinase
VTTSPAPLRLLLVGMMGSGKTTVGRAVASSTGWPYVDNDELVAAVSGRLTAQVGAGGAEALHVVEAVVVAEILAMPTPLVAGIPGSAVAAVDTREHLRSHGTVVWLRARLDTLAARVGDGAGRPFFAGRDVSAVLHELYAGRAPAYAAAAHLTVDVDDRSPDEIVAWILEHLPCVRSAEPGV